MGVSTTAKRGDARSTSSGPSHVQREVIGVLLITAALLILLSLLSFVPGDAKIFTGSGPVTAPPAKNMIGRVGAVTAATSFFVIGGAAYLFP
ncbi:MAG TPA: DNA translocase FtsK 4TM domain-containing protein, partial [Nitrospiraceae bacterium]|nr:DNA translocase FtsK 4TM domain-containing protein [Nitrospiraceae bacterium]